MRDYEQFVASQTHAEDGAQISEYSRIVLQTNEIPVMIKQAILSTEDESFFKYSGVSFLGTLRYIFFGVLHDALQDMIGIELEVSPIGHNTSNITSQIVRTFSLKGNNFERQIKEVMLIERIENIFIEEEILSIYLNQVYFGNHAYGIEAAAQNFFKKTANTLTIAEAAMIVSLAKAPSTLSSAANRAKIKLRQEYLIDRMYEKKYITYAQARDAKAQKLIFHEVTTGDMITL